VGINFAILAVLIVAQKNGQFIFYRLNTSVFQDIISWITNLIDKEKES